MQGLSEEESEAATSFIDLFKADLSSFSLKTIWFT